MISWPHAQSSEPAKDSTSHRPQPASQNSSTKKSPCLILFPSPHALVKIPPLDVLSNVRNALLDSILNWTTWPCSLTLHATTLKISKPDVATIQAGVRTTKRDATILQPTKIQKQPGLKAARLLSIKILVNSPATPGARRMALIFAWLETVPMER